MKGIQIKNSILKTFISPLVNQTLKALENHNDDLPSAKKGEAVDTNDPKFAFSLKSKWVIELPGKREHGSILFIRQMHNHPSFKHNMKQIVGKYQLNILKLLQGEKPHHVFVESLYEDFPPDHPERNNKLGLCNAVRIYFGEVAPSQSDPNFLAELASIGAAKVYACLNKEVFLHKTLTKQEYRDIDAKVNEGLKGSEYNKYVFELREQLATREIGNFLKNHPGKEVVLIYGGHHQFNDNFSTGALQPKLTSVNFMMPIPEFEGLE